MTTGGLGGISPREPDSPVDDFALYRVKKSGPQPLRQNFPKMTPRHPIACIGSSHWDIIGRSSQALAAGQDASGIVSRSPGGVALNAASALASRGLKPALLSAVGEDQEGIRLMELAAQRGIYTSHMSVAKGLPTDSYLIIEDSRGVFATVGDSACLEAVGDGILQPLEGGNIWPAFSDRVRCLVDGNLAGSTLQRARRWAESEGADLRAVSASPRKAARLMALASAAETTVYMNLEEASEIAGQTLASSRQAGEALLDLGFWRALVTDGKNEAADASRSERVFATPPRIAAKNPNGAGDRFAALHLACEIAGLGRESALGEALGKTAECISEGASP